MARLRARSCRRARESLKLTDEQKKKVEELQKEVDAKIQKMLTEEQNKQLKALKDNAGRGFAGGVGGGFGGGQDAPRNLGELSEKDVMNVLAIVRKDFNIEDKRIYLIGHSMGGGGTWHLGTKYSDVWAGLAPSRRPRSASRPDSTTSREFPSSSCRATKITWSGRRQRAAGWRNSRS